MKETAPLFPAMSDEDILRLFGERNEDAIRETDRQWGRLLRDVAYRILGDKEDSEECVSDAYLRIWNAIPPARPQSLRAYAVQTLRHVAIDRYHENRRRRRIPSELTVSMEDCADLLSGGEAPDEGVQAEAVSALIGAYLRTLPEQRRFIFLERFYFAEPVETIAKELHVTRSAVYKELARTKDELKRYLAENGVYV